MNGRKSTSLTLLFAHAFLQCWLKYPILRIPYADISSFCCLNRCTPACSLRLWWRTCCNVHSQCASGCVVECRICNREVAGSNLGRGYFAPRSTQSSTPPWSVNKYQLRLGRQRQVWLIPIADERVGVQVKLWNPLRTRAIPERFCGGDSLRSGAISSVCTFYLYLTFTPNSAKGLNGSLIRVTTLYTRGNSSARLPAVVAPSRRPHLTLHSVRRLSFRPSDPDSL